MKETEKAAAPFGIRLVVVEAGGPRLRAGVLDDEIIELMAKHRPPAIYEWRHDVEEEGGLMALGSTIFELRRVAS